jgi:hypothetical protein
MLSARASPALQASDATSNANIRDNLDNARMVVSPLREVGLSYTLGNSLDGRKAGKSGGARCNAAALIADCFSERVR